MLVLATGAASAAIVQVPESFPVKWDLADPPPEGATEHDLRRLLDEAVFTRRRRWTPRKSRYMSLPATPWQVVGWSGAIQPTVTSRSFFSPENSRWWPKRVTATAHRGEFFFSGRITIGVSTSMPFQGRPLQAMGSMLARFCSTAVSTSRPAGSHAICSRHIWRRYARRTVRGRPTALDGMGRSLSCRARVSGVRPATGLSFRGRVRLSMTSRGAELSTSGTIRLLSTRAATAVWSLPSRRPSVHRWSN